MRRPESGAHRPHGASSPRHDGLRGRAPLPRPRSFDEPDISDKPAFLRRRSPRLSPAAQAQIAASYRARQESLLAVDEAVEGIVRALRRKRVLRRTYIVVTSDNGFLQGEPFKSGKCSLRAVLARAAAHLGPGIPAGRRSIEL